MALINCTQCGSPVSNKGKTCPVCGKPVVEILAELNGTAGTEEPPVQSVEAPVVELEQETPVAPPSTTESGSGSAYRVWFWVLTPILAIAAIVLGVLYSDARQFIDDQSRMLLEKDRELSDASSSQQTARREMEELKTLVSQTYPIIIDKIEIGNLKKGGDVYDDYGSTILSRNSMYLTPRISYTGLKNGNINLKVKFFDQYGNLSSNSSSPEGFTYEKTVYVLEGSNRVNLTGWGNEYMGSWDSGSYRVEVWYGNCCLMSRSFRVY